MARSLQGSKLEVGAGQGMAGARPGREKVVGGSTSHKTAVGAREVKDLGSLEKANSRDIFVREQVRQIRRLEGEKKGLEIGCAN